MEETDKMGAVLCRFCRFAELVVYSWRGSEVVCTIRNNPGPVDPDVAECDEGEVASDAKRWARGNWPKRGALDDEG